MKMRTKGKMIVSWIVVCVLMLSVFSIGYAADAKRVVKLDALYNNIKIIVNGQQATSPVVNGKVIEPFIVSGTTYVPLRMLAEAFNKDIVWDGAEYKITITDKQDPRIIDLNNRIIQKDIQIAELNKKIEGLEAQIALQNSKGSSSSSSSALRDLEDDLNDDYGTYKNIKFDIELSGKDTKITVKIYPVSSSDQSKWNSLSEANKKAYLQDICDDIRYEYKKAAIEGTVIGSSSKKLTTFSMAASSKTVKLGTSSGGSSDLSDLEDELNDDYATYFKTSSKSTSIPELTIELDGDEDEITFTVIIDLDTYESQWAKLTDAKVRAFMKEIADDILAEYEDAIIEGYIEDEDSGDQFASYKVSSSGKVTFKRF